MVVSIAALCPLLFSMVLLPFAPGPKSIITLVAEPRPET